MLHRLNTAAGVCRVRIIGRQPSADMPHEYFMWLELNIHSLNNVGSLDMEIEGQFNDRLDWFTNLSSHVEAVWRLNGSKTINITEVCSLSRRKWKAMNIYAVLTAGRSMPIIHSSMYNATIQMQIIYLNKKSPLRHTEWMRLLEDKVHSQALNLPTLSY